MPSARRPTWRSGGRLRGLRSARAGHARDRWSRSSRVGRDRGARSAIGREDEQPLPGEPMRDDEVGRLGRVVRTGVRRPLDVDAVAAEDEQVKVELARAPARPLLPAERTLDALRVRSAARARPCPGPGRSGRRGPRQRFGTRAGRRLRPARSRRGATRHGAGLPASPRARARRPRWSRPHHQGLRPARCTPGWSWPGSRPPLARLGWWEQPASSSSTPSPRRRPDRWPRGSQRSAEFLAERHHLAFTAAGATDVRIVAGVPDGRPFGSRCATSWLPAERADSSSWALARSRSRPPRTAWRWSWPPPTIGPAR